MRLLERGDGVVGLARTGESLTLAVVPDDHIARSTAFTLSCVTASCAPINPFAAAFAKSLGA